MTSFRQATSLKSPGFGLLIATLAGIATAVIFWLQVVDNQRQQGLDDLMRRAQLLSYRVESNAKKALEAPDADAQQIMGDRLDGRQRLLGMAVYRPNAKVIAYGDGAGDHAENVKFLVRRALASRDEYSDIDQEDTSIHVFVQPVLDDKGETLGAIAVFHDATYLEERTTRAIVRGMMWSGGVGLAMFFITTGLAWALFERPLFMLAEWMRRLRFGNTPENPPSNLPVSRLADETVHLAASFRAARSKEREDAQEIVRSDKAWTRDRLRAHAIDALGGQTLVVVSNREPYVHQFKNGKPSVMRPASGLVTGLDPVLRATGGLWVAHGAGDADRVTADRDGRIPVPPEDARYTLKRVWISKAEEQGYYYGFSNEGLWPLCHLTHERPVFRASDWEQYVRANKRFADAVLDEIGKEKAVVMVQDYQLALVPGMLKAARPDLRVGLFWHIPWPNAEAFRICPFREELLKGMLGADLLGFHLQQHCNNFLETVDRMVEAKLDWDRFSAEVQGHTALVRPFPISVQSWSERGVATGAALNEQITQLRAQHQLDGCAVGVGVDRVDYTKGIAERFRAIERLFEKYPEHKGKFTFVQLGAPSRTHIPRYRDLVTDLEEMADNINWKLQEGEWKPIHFLVDHHEGPRVYAFLKMAAVCIVSSLHDGMNLVAKEFVAAKSENDEDVPGAAEGVLVLSEFAGAAKDLPEALIVNPYDTEEFADAVHQAIIMDEKDRRQRMTRMRLRIEEFNIYRWAADFLTSLAQAKHAPASPTPEVTTKPNVVPTKTP
jgi:trehalose 6-phosphate synthase